MTSSDVITVIGVVVTIGSMIVSIAQARKAASSSDKARKAMTAVQLAAVAERLRSVQEHIREVAPMKTAPRGFKADPHFDLIRREFDTALSILPKTGPGGEARSQLTKAQSALNSYHSTYTTSPSSTAWQILQTGVQDAISDLTSTNLDLGE